MLKYFHDESEMLDFHEALQQLQTAQSRPWKAFMMQQKKVKSYLDNVMKQIQNGYLRNLLSMEAQRMEIRFKHLATCISAQRDAVSCLSKWQRCHKKGGNAFPCKPDGEPKIPREKKITFYLGNENCPKNQSSGKPDLERS